MLNVPNPMEAFTGGITAGQSALQAIENARKIQAQRVAEQAAAEQQEQLMADIAAFQERPSYEAAMGLATRLPKDQYVNLIGAFESKTKEQQQNELRFGGQVMSALVGGKNDVAVMLLERQAEALGDTPEAEDLRRTAELVKNDPSGALGIVATSYAPLPGSKDIIDRAFAAKAAPQAREKMRLEIDQLGKTLNLTEQQILKAQLDVDILGFNAAKAKLELDSFEPGKIPNEKKFDMEVKLSDRYQKKVAPLEESRRTFTNMKTSAAAATGQGDIALITQFMKMLDPGSVVRETEFATAQNAAGYYESLKARLQRLQGAGEILTPAAREQYITLAKQYLDAAEKEGKQTQEAMRPIISNYGLNEKNIFGGATEEVDY
jgi:hypothetical protein